MSAEDGNCSIGANKGLPSTLVLFWHHTSLANQRKSYGPFQKTTYDLCSSFLLVNGGFLRINYRYGKIQAQDTFWYEDPYVHYTKLPPLLIGVPPSSNIV